MAHTCRFFLWDTESTSKDPRKDAIISIGGVLCNFNSYTNKFVPIAEFHTYVSTHKKIDPQAEAIHHINQAQLINQPTFPEAIEILVTFLRQHQPEPNSELYFVAHNGTAFDNIILYCNFVTNRLDFDDFLSRVHCRGFVDTLKVLKALFKSCKVCELPKDRKTQRVSYALGNCYTSFCNGNILENAHDALADSQALVSIFNSQAVCAKFTFTKLRTFVVNRNKGVEAVKKSAGVFIQDREDQNKRQRLQEQDPTYVPVDTFAVPSVTPLYENPKFYGTNDTGKRLCINCMSFVHITQHTVCQTQPLEYRNSHENSHEIASQ